jgi:hypothetical protein
VAIAVADLLDVLSTRTAATLVAVGLDGTAASPVLMEAAATAARDSGLRPAAPYSLTDADLGCADHLASQLADVGELRALESALNALMKPDQRISLGEKRWGGLRGEMERTIARRESYCEDRYGIGRGTVVGGVVGLRINEPLWPGNFC